LKINRNHTIVFLSLSLILAGCGSGSATNTASTANAAAATTTTTSTPTASVIPSLQPFTTPTGTVATDSATGSVDPSGVFFQSLGTNARTCATCHQLSQGMSISAASTQALFSSSNGTDPLFAAVDGANCPTAATGDPIGHSLVINNGLIRIAVELPANAQFKLATTQDPYGCAVTPDAATGQQIVSVYRRPLPSASLTFLSTIMWDTRETVSPLNAAASFSANLNADLSAQAVAAVATHEQGSAAPTSTQLSQLVAFEEGLYTAQETDNQAGSLSAAGASGGAANLAAQGYYPGINDALGQDPKGVAFNPAVFTLFQAWRNSANPQQASIARGEDIFNTAPMNITSVRGLNDNPAIGSPAVIHGSCSTCHDTPNVGNHSFPLPLDTGTSHSAAAETNPAVLAGLGQLTVPVLPVYQITGCADVNGNPAVYATTDPGTGLFSGLCADVNRVKVPVLRGLAARAPYFHNGSAGNLGQVVNFYNTRFQMNLSPPQLTDLENFLNAL
jgi:cytochrome c peroxidase